MTENFPSHTPDEFEKRRKDLLHRIEDIKYKIIRLEKDNMEEVDETVIAIRSGLIALSMTLSQQYTQSLTADDDTDE